MQRAAVACSNMSVAVAVVHDGWSLGASTAATCTVLLVPLSVPRKHLSLPAAPPSRNNLGTSRFNSPASANSTSYEQVS
jgi:hypothetical protein